MSGLVKACCSVPPVEANYTKKGEVKEDIAGLKTYVVGEGKTLILYVYDIFGYTPQAYQGADIIASQGYTVYIPDFFKGVYLDASNFAPPQTPEKGAAIGAYFGGAGNPKTGVENIEKIVKYAKENGFEKVGALGFCWGAKPVMLAPSLDFKSGIHPSLLAPEDGEAITVPTALWPTVDEDATIMDAIKKSLEAKPFADKNLVHTYSEYHHGFAAARANLEDEADRKAFTEAFTNIVSWFKKVAA